MKKTFLGTTAMMLMLAGAVLAQAPDTIMYQGRITDGAGVPIEGDTEVRFSIWSAATAGSELWFQLKTVTAAQGVFTTELGPIASPATVFDGSMRYLELQVTGESAMTPRQVVNAVPYAMSAGTATPGANSVDSATIVNNSITSADVQNSTLTGSDIANGSVYDLDIGDEPGIAASYNGGSLALTATHQVIGTVTLNAPSAGYVVVNAEANWDPNHVTGTRSICEYSLSTTTSANGLRFISVPASTGTNSDIPMPIFCTQVFSVSAGNSTFNLLARNWSGTGNVRYRRMVAQFFPTAYGTLSKSAGDAERTTPGSPRTGE